MNEKRVGRLVRKSDGVEVPIGSKLTVQDEDFILRGWRKPHKEGSTGRVFVIPVDHDRSTFERQLFPNVFGLEIVDFDL